MKHLIIIFVSMLFIISCNEKIPTETTTGDGNVLLSFNKSEIPESVSLIEVILSKEDFDDITEKLRPQNDSNTEVYFEEIAVGDWNLKVNAYSVNNKLLYTGEAIISVVANIVTPVFLQLKYVNGYSTGSVFIYITWEDNGLEYWLDYRENPILVKQNSNLDYKGVAHPCVLKTEDKHIMWYTSLSGSSSYIYAAVSSDGLNWIPYSSQPVLSPDPASNWKNTIE